MYNRELAKTELFDSKSTPVYEASELDKTDVQKLAVDRTTTDTESRARGFLQKEKDARLQQGTFVLNYGDGEAIPGAAWGLDNISFFMALAEASKAQTKGTIAAQQMGLATVSAYSGDIEKVNAQLSSVQLKLQDSIDKLEHPPTESFWDSFKMFFVAIVVTIAVTALTAGIGSFLGVGAGAATAGAAAGVDGAAAGANAIADVAASVAEAAGETAQAVAQAASTLSVDTAEAANAAARLAGEAVETATSALSGTAGEVADAAETVVQAPRAVSGAAQRVGDALAQEAANAALSTAESAATDAENALSSVANIAKTVGKGLEQLKRFVFGPKCFFVLGIPGAMTEVGVGASYASNDVAQKSQNFQSGVQTQLTQDNVDVQILDNTSNRISAKSSSAMQSLVVNQEQAQTSASQMLSSAMQNWVTTSQIRIQA